MAGKGGGGSWKVAYADFVTAMMAFFLVMWIGAQDTKVRQSVANYFVDPNGASKKPTRAGAVLDTLSSGDTPQAQSVDVGQGRQSHDPSGEQSPVTKLIHNWIFRDKKLQAYWREQAVKQRKAAAQSLEVLGKGESVEAVAANQLAMQLQYEIKQDSFKEKNGLYDQMLSNSFKEVNWVQLAQDLLRAE